MIVLPRVAPTIPEDEIEFTYVRSSGPGGQNVNKVNSKAVLRWNVLSSRVLNPATRARLFEKLGTRISGEGDLVLASDRFRDQGRNREDCLTKLRELVAAALTPPKPRKETKPTRSSKRRKLDSKSRHSDKKKMRGRPFED